MKFFTPELYEQMQGDVDSAAIEGFEARWQCVCDAYRAHLENIRPALPSKVQAFSAISLHDGIVRKVDRPVPSELVLEVDATRNPWGPKGVFRVRFIGVHQVEGISDLIGDYWLYEEVHLHADGFDYRVLFSDSVFRVVAEDVELQPLPASSIPE